MNKILIALNVLLTAAVVFLFVKVYQPAAESTAETGPAESGAAAVNEVTAPDTAKAAPLQAGNTPTGRIAYVNIDRLNDESLEIIDLIAETTRRKNNIEASMEALNQQYQKKVEDFQMSQKAGIATENDMRAKAREIETIEREAQNKQLQMDNLTMDISEKNMKFQERVRTFLQKWNAGKYDYIFSFSEAAPYMLLGNSALEVTNEVITELNSEYKQRKGKK